MRNYSTKIAIESVLGLQLTPVAIAEKEAEPRDSSGRKKNRFLSCLLQTNNQKT